MRIFQSLSLVVALAVCYLWFFHSQTALQPDVKAPDAATALTPETSSVATLPPSGPRTQYKADIDRARNVASQTKAARGEPASF